MTTRRITRYDQHTYHIIDKSPRLSPERIDNYEIDLKPNTWNPAFGKTVAMYLEDRAIQLYYYASGNEPTGFMDGA